MQYHKEIKNIIILGTKNVGKTSLIKKFIFDIFDLSDQEII